MGWASGSSLFNDIINALMTEGVPPETRYFIYKSLIVSFQDHDWDTEDECEGTDPAFDRALKELFEGD